MKKNYLWMLAVIVACGALFSSCKEKYDPSGSGDIDLSDPLTIEAVEEGEVDLTLEVNLPEPVYYSVNGGEKKVVAKVDEEKGVTYTTLELKAGDKVQLFSRNTKLSDQENSKYFNIYFESECYVYGNVMSLISPDDNWKDNKEIKAPSVFAGLFVHASIATHPTRRLLLPATKLTKDCYTFMFSDSSIEVAPALPATQLANRCYAYMFEGCTSLTSAIELPALDLPERCYSSMFNKCKKLSSIKCLATTMSGNYALLWWLKNAGTDPSVSTPTLTHAKGTPWVNSDEDAPKSDGWYVPTTWTLVSL